MNARMKVLSLFVSIVLVVGLCPTFAFADDLTASAFSFSVQAAGTNDYPAEYKNAKKATVADSWGFKNRQDTSFVAWRLNNDNAIAFTSSYKGTSWGDARNWGTAAKGVGLVVDSVPAVGTVAWWTTGTSGHVAWVQSVTGDKVTVEEYDYDGKGNYGTRTVSKAGVTGFIHIKDLNADGSTLPTANIDMLPGVYSISPKCASGMNLAIQSGSPDNAANALIKKASSSLAQSFAITGSANAYRFSPLCSDGKCLDVDGNKKVNGTNVRQYAANNTAAQNWTFRSAGDGYYYIVAGNGLVLDVSGGSSKSGANVQVYAFNGTDAQKWRLDVVRTTVDAGRYSFAPRCAEKYRLDISGGGSAARTNVQIYAPNGTNAQAFSLISTDQNYAISPLCADAMRLDVSGNGTAAGTNVHIYNANNTPAQDWTLQDAGDGYYYVRANNGLYLDVAGGTAQSRTNVDVYTFNAGDAQKWKIERATSSDMGFMRVTAKSVAYTGSEVKAKPTVINGSAKLVRGTDYKVSYRNNVNAGTAKLTVKGIGAYKGSKTVNFTVKAAQIKKASAKAFKARKYTGKEIKPKPKLNYKGKALKLGTDYTLSYKDNTNRGTAIVTITGKGNFKGEKTMKFVIK